MKSLLEFENIIKKSNHFNKEWFRRWIIENPYHFEEFSEEDVFVDIGANHGYVSAYAAYSGAGTVLSFEALPFLYEAALNVCEPFPIVKLHNNAVWLSDVPSQTVKIDGRVGHGNQRAIINGISHKGYTVETIGLDDILKPLDTVAFLKVDCEGSEYAILYTSKLLATKVKRIVCETHKFVPSNTPEDLKDRCNFYDLIDYLKDIGFKILGSKLGRKNGHIIAVKD